MSKKRALNLFLKITFFCSLLLLLTPETLPNHLSGKLATKNGQKTSRKEEKTFFFIIFFTFSLSPYGKKQNHLLFPPFLSLEKKNRKGKRPIRIFFFFYLTFSHPTAPRNQKNYHLPFFRNSDLKCPKIPISALKFHFLQITFFSAVITRTHHLPTHTPFF